MGDAYNSPGGEFLVIFLGFERSFLTIADPVFYTHHGNLDRIWWQWQKKDPAKRLKDVSGPIVPFDYTNLVAGNITLDFEVNLGKLGKSVPLRQLLDTTGGTLCYTYDK